jgi:hypothetical protein
MRLVQEDNTIPPWLKDIGKYGGALVATIASGLAAFGRGPQTGSLSTASASLTVGLLASVLDKGGRAREIIEAALRNVELGAALDSLTPYADSSSGEADRLFQDLHADSARIVAGNPSATQLALVDKLLSSQAGFYRSLQTVRDKAENLLLFSGTMTAQSQKLLRDLVSSLGHSLDLWSRNLLVYQQSLRTLRSSPM